MKKIQSFIWNPTTKRYLISSLTTFLTGFTVAFVAQLDGFTMQSITIDLIFGAVFVGLRAGFKAVVEWVIVQTTGYKTELKQSK